MKPIDILMNADFRATHRHKNGNVYEELFRPCSETKIPANTLAYCFYRPDRMLLCVGTNQPANPADLICTVMATDLIVPNEELVIYRTEAGVFYARPSPMFDEPDRFKPL